MLTGNCKKFNLSWLCRETGQKHSAGVAFFNQPQGDYRLKIDIFPEERTVYLKAVSLTDGMVHYRVETLIKKNGKLSHRADIGSGYSNEQDGYPIYMDIGPFQRLLVLEDAG